MSAAIIKKKTLELLLLLLRHVAEQQAETETESHANHKPVQPLQLRLQPLINALSLESKCQNVHLYSTHLCRIRLFFLPLRQRQGPNNPKIAFKL